MQSTLRPYLNFKDNARQAMEFYKSVFGGELDVRTFKDFQAAQDPAEDDLVMHSSLVVSDGINFMASDTPHHLTYTPGSNFSLSLSGDQEAELTGYFEKLAEGGTVTMPLAKAAWGDTFGMCIDKFGVSWLINISPAANEG